MAKLKSEYNREWNANNIERIRERRKNWPSYNSEYQKQWHKNNQSSYYIVYLLPIHNYVGVTNNPTKRMYDHKSIHKRDTTGWIELARFNTREEALEYESIKHTEGYEGKKITRWQKQQTVTN